MVFFLPSSINAQSTPCTPTNVIAIAGNGQATVSWSTLTSGDCSASGAIYQVYMNTYPNPVCSTYNTGCTVTGLTNGTPYYFVVSSLTINDSFCPTGNCELTNFAGISSPSDTVTPATVPGPPTNVMSAIYYTYHTTGYSSGVQVDWNAPVSDGGDSIISYTATCNPGGEICTATEVLGTSELFACIIDTCSVPIMDDAITVTATNAMGTGPASNPINPLVGLVARSASQSFLIHSTGSSLILSLPSITASAKITILDLLGREVLSQNVAAGVREISLNTKGNSISPGLYIVRLTQSNSGHGSNLIAESKVLLGQ